MLDYNSFCSLERLGESGATHDSQSASRSGVEAWVARNLNGWDDSDAGLSKGWVGCPSGLASLHHSRLSTRSSYQLYSFSGDRRFCYANHGSFVYDSPNLFCGPSGSVRTGLPWVRSEPGHRTHLTSLLFSSVKFLRFSRFCLVGAWLHQEKKIGKAIFHCMYIVFINTYFFFFKSGYCSAYTLLSAQDIEEFYFFHRAVPRGRECCVPPRAKKGAVHNTPVSRDLAIGFNDMAVHAIQSTLETKSCHKYDEPHCLTYGINAKSAL